MAGDEVTGATTFRLEEGLDTGPVFGTLTEAVRPDDTGGDLLARLAGRGRRACSSPRWTGSRRARSRRCPSPAEGVSAGPQAHRRRRPGRLGRPRAAGGPAWCGRARRPGGLDDLPRPSGSSWARCTADPATTDLAPGDAAPGPRRGAGGHGQSRRTPRRPPARGWRLGAGAGLGKRRAPDRRGPVRLVPDRTRPPPARRRRLAAVPASRRPAAAGAPGRVPAHGLRPAARRWTSAMPTPTSSWPGCCASGALTPGTPPSRPSWPTARCAGAARYDAVLAACVSRPLAEVDPPVLDVLRLGAHQLLATRIPTHAAVSATVELARAVAGEGPAKFVNAVLRKVSAARSRGLAGPGGPRRGAGPGRAPRRRAQPPAVGRAGVPRRPRRCLGRRRLVGADRGASRGGQRPAPGHPGRPTRPVHRGGAGRRRGGAGSLLALGRACSPRVTRTTCPRCARAAPGCRTRAASSWRWRSRRAPVAGHRRRWLDLCAGPGGKAALLGRRRRRARRAAGRNEVAPHRAALVARAVAGSPARVIVA